MAERKAAKVLPEPVGAAISASPPRWMTGQARRCGSVGSRNRPSNQRATAGWKPESDMTGIWFGSPRGGAPGSAAQYPFQGCAPDGRDPLDRLTDLVIRRGGSGRHADGDRAFRKPGLTALLALRAHRPEPDAPGRGIDAARVLDVVGGHLLVADRREVGRVARVVAPDHDHEVERFGNQLQDGVLAVLRRPTTSSSDSRRRPARDPGRDRTPGTEHARSGPRTAPGSPSPHPRCRRTPHGPPPCPAPPGSARRGTWSPGWRWPWSPRGSTCRGSRPCSRPARRSRPASTRSARSRRWY